MAQGVGLVRKAVILAGGYGTRLMEETEARPKPMVEIGGRPMLWHIMKIYSSHGIDEFVIPLGYKGYMIKEFFANYRLHMSDVTFDYGRNDTAWHIGRAEAWKVTLVDTGLETMTGGRLKRLRDYVGDAPFCGPNTLLAPCTPSSGLSTSVAATRVASRSRGTPSTPAAATSAAPPYGRARPVPSNGVTPSAVSMPSVPAPWSVP